jgi:hypothetical protein
MVQKPFYTNFYLQQQTSLVMDINVISHGAYNCNVWKVQTLVPVQSCNGFLPYNLSDQFKPMEQQTSLALSSTNSGMLLSGF